ncbi:MAG: hypothetical protein PHF70_12805, partial [Opitutales bacterium]|nr:hypothetical protein [Opitutales bacterium]
MKEDRNDLEAGQGLIIDSSESLREHLRGSVRDALKEIFEQEIRNLCGKRYHPEGSNCRRAGTAPSYVMTDVGREANLLFQSNNAGVGNLTISATNIIGAAYRNAHASRYGDEDWGAKKRPQPPLGKLRPIILARTYSHTECYRTTIGGWGLNERVRNG